MFNLKAIVLLSIINLTNGEYYEKCINKNHITLTFDDGPNKNTQGLVDVLNKYGIKGTFFINGLHIIRNKVEAVPKIAEDVLGKVTFDKYADAQFWRV